MVLNLAHYSFFPIADAVSAKRKLESDLVGKGIAGTILLASEGININLAGPEQSLRSSLTRSLEDLGCQEFDYKTSFSDFLPFKRLKIRVKREIVTLGIPELDVSKWRAPHVSARDFHKIIERQETDTLLLDTRNDFEVGVGTFKGATPAGMRSFRQFPSIAASLPRDKKIVMFCTGGIRCEKASAYLRSQGFERVLQLRGGILKYFELEGKDDFLGSCFVFDERTSLDASPFPGDNIL